MCRDKTMNSYLACVQETGQSQEKRRALQEIFSNGYPTLSSPVPHALSFPVPNLSSVWPFDEYSKHISSAWILTQVENIQELVTKDQHAPTSTIPTKLPFARSSFRPVNAMLERAVISHMSRHLIDPQFAYTSSEDDVRTRTAAMLMSV